MSVKIFLSTVSDEFRVYRDLLRSDLTRHNVEVKVQENFKDLGGDTLDKLDVYIANCDAVVHLVGHMTGATAGTRDVAALFVKYPDLSTNLPPLERGEGISYTHWEAWLALYHRKDLFIVQAGESAERGPRYAPTDASRAGQAEHLRRLKEVERYPGYTFTSPIDLANHLKSTGILDLLVKAYAEESARARDVAEGFIHEMAQKVAGDRKLDFEGMKQAVRNAIDIYEREIAGEETETNVGAIVDEALARARSLVDAGKSGLAQAGLRKAAEAMRREEEERRERYVAGIRALYHRARDIALAAYDGAAAADAIVVEAEAIHGPDTAIFARSLDSEAAALYEYGRDRGSNVHLTASIALRRKLLDAALSEDERGTARDKLGLALATLGARERGTARLEEAVEAFHAALEDRTQQRAPLKWAMTQLNLGTALARLGERESGTQRFEEAAASFRAALKEYTQERAPIEWAKTQNNLGNVLARLGERESGTGKLEEAIAAYREALKERTQERAPRDWSSTQNNLGNALTTLGERESGTASLEEAVLAYREALKEWTQERVPLGWALTQNNLGNALTRLGEREGGTESLKEAVSAYREALKERTQERVPLDWAMTQMNLGAALVRLGDRESDTEKLEEAVLAYREALKERTRECVPLDWAKTQDNLGTVLSLVGKRESGTASLEEAVLAYREALKERTQECVPLQWAITQMNLGTVLLRLGERESGTGRLEESVTAFTEALKELTRQATPQWHITAKQNLAQANALLAQRAAVPKSAPPSPPARPGSATAQPAGDIFAALERLAGLHGKGILSDEEFASKKAELLSRL
jgi:tetratricopeptide (TPR) repeat protein